MSNSPRNRPPGKKPVSPNSAPTSDRNGLTPWIIGGVLAVVVALAAVIAIVTSSGDDGDTSSAATVSVIADGTAPADGSGGSGASLEQNRPVTITGTPLPALPDSGDDAAIGMTIPSVTGQSFDGSAVEIQPGTPTLVAFVAHWCPHCQREVPRLVEWEASGDVPTGIDVIGVSTAVTPDRGNYPPSTWLSEAGWPWPVMADSELDEAANAFGLTSFPYFVFYGADGKVLFRTSGEVEMDDLSQMIDDALAG